MRLAATALACVALALAGSCKSVPGGATSAVTVQDQGARTVVVTTAPNGTVTEDHSGDPELVGPKEVGLAVSMFVPTHLKTVRLTFWPAGNRVAEQSVAIEVDQVFEPASGGLGSFHTVAIPGSAELETCEALYYMWTVTYEKLGSTPGIYVGQPKRIMPTKRRLPNGAIEQASCAEPPGP